MVSKVKKQYAVVSIIGVSILILINAWLYYSRYDLLNNHTKLLFTTYSDAERNVNSTIALHADANALAYSYVLKNQYKDHPYAGVTIRKKDNTFFKAGNHCLHLVGRTTGSQTINLRVEVFADGFTDTTDLYTYIYVQKIITGQNGVIDKEIDLDDLEIPSWWIRKRGLTADQMPAFTFDKTAHIILDHDPTLTVNKKASIQLTTLAFIIKPTSVLLYNGVCLLLFLIISFIYILIKKNKIAETIIVAAPLIRTETPDIQGSKEHRIVTYLSTHYQLSELSLTQMSKELGLSTRTISDSIKAKYGLSFKQYLNFLRMEEAKHLLTTTSLQVKEIAFQVGYDNQQHFLRVFKLMYNTTPSEFKKNLSEQ